MSASGSKRMGLAKTGFNIAGLPDHTERSGPVSLPFVVWWGFRVPYARAYESIYDRSLLILLGRFG